MINKIPKQPQLEMYKTILVNFINPNHELYQLASQIDWDGLESDFASYYSKIGRPAVPVRKIVGLLLLKHIYNLSDEAVISRWLENPYWQSRYFGMGKSIFSMIPLLTPLTLFTFANALVKRVWSAS